MSPQKTYSSAEVAAFYNTQGTVYQAAAGVIKNAQSADQARRLIASVGASNPGGKQAKEKLQSLLNGFSGSMRELSAFLSDYGGTLQNAARTAEAQWGKNNGGKRLQTSDIDTFDGWVDAVARKSLTLSGSRGKWYNSLNGRFPAGRSAALDNDVLFATLTKEAPDGALSRMDPSHPEELSKNTFLPHNRKNQQELS